MFPETYQQQAEHLLERLHQKRWRLAAAESCTGGLIAALLTDIPGASEVFDRGYVTYSNQAKIDMLGVDPALIEKHGAVSQPVAEAMAGGALSKADVSIAVSVTGIAGPGGGTAEKPVGLVFIAVATKSGTIAHRYLFSGDRDAIRRQSVFEALGMVESAIV